VLVVCFSREWSYLFHTRLAPDYPSFRFVVTVFCYFSLPDTFGRRMTDFLKVTLEANEVSPNSGTLNAI